jgi:hypothetical protein
MTGTVGYFGDKRLAKNGELIIQRMIERKTVKLRRLASNRAEEVRINRWIGNDNVTQEELIETITQKSQSAVEGRHVLGIQDTSEINYQAHVNRVKGLGRVGNGEDVGFFIHPMLLVDAEEETCLGLGAIKIWNRRKAAEKRYQKQPIEEKESYRWIETAEVSKQVLSGASKITVVADRESDIYEEWHRIPDAKTEMITRACRDRQLMNGKLLFSHVEELEIKGVYELKVDKRIGKRSEHVARLEIRYGEIEIKKPGKCTDKEAPGKITLRVVDVREIQESVVGNEKPIHWCLLTTHEVGTEEGALQIIKWYCLRWNIEQLFRTLKKQGLDVESSQVETAEGLMKLVILALYVALQTMQLTLAREGKEQRVSIVFDENQCKVLSILQRKLEGKTEKQRNPHEPGKLSWAAWIIARLGGWKGYQSESPPGPITMLRGLEYFKSLFQGYQLRDVCID